MTKVHPDAVPQFCPAAVETTEIENRKSAVALSSWCEGFRGLVLRGKGHKIKAVLINESPLEYKGAIHWKSHYYYGYP